MCIFLIQAQETPLLEKEEPLVVNSGEAQYDGKEIILTGQVIVQHSLGQISARRLSIQSSIDKEKRKNTYGLLKISQDVQLKLPEGGHLYCQEAAIDYANKQGIFLGSVEAPDVVYLNTGEKQENSLEERPFLEVKSQQMILEITQEPKNSKTLVKQIEANQNIRVYYNRDYLLLADHALYQRLPTVENSAIAGLLTLSVQNDHPFCQMTTLNGDHLFAQTIQMNTIKRTLWLSTPSGILYMRQDPSPVQTLEFKADELLWDDLQQTLHLKGQIKLTQNGTVEVQTDHELLITQMNVNGKRMLRSIQAPDHVQISYIDASKGNTHKMYCPGSFLIDHERQQMVLQGLPRSLEGEGEQVSIEDVLGEMYADAVSINYYWQEGRLVPEKMILKGHVQLLNRFDGHVEEASSILHYALADHVEYFPNNQEMILRGEKSQRVLFFDKVNNIQMSASSLKVKHDIKTHKDSIQGIGDVRFTFIEKEFEQIKQRFRSEISQEH